MPPKKIKFWWQLHVNVLNEQFKKYNTRTSIRYKCLALMSIINTKASAFGETSGVSSTEIAEEYGFPLSGITEPLQLLEEWGFIRRFPAAGRGGRLTVTPLSQAYWKIGKEGNSLAASDHVPHEPVSEKKSTINKIDMHHNYYVEPAQVNWEPVYKNVFDYIAKVELSAYEPSKILGVLDVIILNVEGYDSPCPLSQKELGKIIKQNEASVGKSLGHLEAAGVVKRVRGQGHNIIKIVKPNN